MGTRYIPDHKRTYEHLIGHISGMSESLGFPISPETQKDLIVALKIMGYVDHQYDKKDQLEQQEYAQKMVEKLQKPESVDMGEIDYVFTELANLLKNKDLSHEFIFYSKKILAHNAEACHTDNIDVFIKHKYLEGYTSAKIITLFLSNEGMDHQIDMLLCNLVAISNLLDDLLDINQDFEQGVSVIPPSLKLKLQLALNVFWHTIDKFILSGKMSPKTVKYIVASIGSLLNKKFFNKVLDEQ